jgi:hypothetical protein
MADDCNKRASESDSVDAIRLYQQAEREARHAAVALHMGDYMRREALARCEAMLTLARSYDGESIADEYDAAQERGEVKAANNAKTTSNVEAVSAPLLKVGQLAAMYGMGERRVRRAIERCYRRREPGFHRDGALWLAEREAFERLPSVRIVSAPPGHGSQAS